MFKMAVILTLPVPAARLDAPFHGRGREQSLGKELVSTSSGWAGEIEAIFNIL
jgi:hypothetical protein